MTTYNYLFSAVATSTAQATVQPTIGLLPMPSFSRELCVRVHTAHSVGHISNGYRPYAVRPCVYHWTSIPYEAILCQNPGRNLPEKPSLGRTYIL